MARSHGSRLPNRLYQDQGPASPSRRRLSSLRCGPRRSYARSMADKSAIEWTEATWNPATGFDRISSGCDNCYALTLAKRLKAIGNAKYQKDGDPRTSGPGFGGDLHPSALGLPYTWREPRRVFVTSMSDLFHAHVPTCFVAEVFKVMVETPRHSYQVLTKRPRRVARLAASLPWPENIWMGVTSRIKRLRGERTPAFRWATPRLAVVAALVHCFPYIGFPRAVAAIRAVKNL
jgi:protein gp37